MKYLGLFLLLMLVSCRETGIVNGTGELPPGATQPVAVGNGWYEFQYRNRCYAYTLEVSYGFHRQTAVFEVDCKP